MYFIEELSKLICGSDFEITPDTTHTEFLKEYEGKGFDLWSEHNIHKHYIARNITDGVERYTIVVYFREECWWLITVMLSDDKSTWSVVDEDNKRKLEQICINTFGATKKEYESIDVSFGNEDPHNNTLYNIYISHKANCEKR